MFTVKKIAIAAGQIWCRRRGGGSCMSFECLEVVKVSHDEAWVRNKDTKKDARWITHRYLLNNSTLGKRSDCKLCTLLGREATAIIE